MIDINNTDISSQFETKGRPLILNEKDVLDHVPNYHSVRNLISVFFLNYLCIQSYEIVLFFQRKWIEDIDQML